MPQQGFGVHEHRVVTAGHHVFVVAVAAVDGIEHGQQAPGPPEEVLDVRGLLAGLMHRPLHPSVTVAVEDAQTAEGDRSASIHEPAEQVSQGRFTGQVLGLVSQFHARGEVNGQDRLTVAVSVRQARLQGADLAKRLTVTKGLGQGGRVGPESLQEAGVDRHPLTQQQAQTAGQDRVFPEQGNQSAELLPGDKGLVHLARRRVGTVPQKTIQGRLAELTNEPKFEIEGGDCHMGQLTQQVTLQSLPGGRGQLIDEGGCPLTQTLTGPADERDQQIDKRLGVVRIEPGRRRGRRSLIGAQNVGQEQHPIGKRRRRRQGDRLQGAFERGGGPTTPLEKPGKGFFVPARRQLAPLLTASGDKVSVQGLAGQELRGASLLQGTGPGREGTEIGIREDR